MSGCKDGEVWRSPTERAIYMMQPLSTPSPYNASQETWHTTNRRNRSNLLPRERYFVVKLHERHDRIITSVN